MTSQPAPPVTTVLTANLYCMVSMLKATPLMPDVKEILLPGERAWQTQQQQLKNGIPVPEPVAADLLSLATRLGVAVPAALARGQPVTN